MEQKRELQVSRRMLENGKMSVIGSEEADSLEGVDIYGITAEFAQDSEKMSVIGSEEPDSLEDVDIYYGTSQKESTENVLIQLIRANGRALQIVSLK